MGNPLKMYTCKVPHHKMYLKSEMPTPHRPRKVSLLETDTVLLKSLLCAWPLAWISTADSLLKWSFTAFATRGVAATNRRAVSAGAQMFNLLISSLCCFRYSKYQKEEWMVSSLEQILMLPKSSWSALLATMKAQCSARKNRLIEPESVFCYNRLFLD